ncbi:MAG: succinylglutamate desuccinylase/aspartoacylase family protein [Candidatus Heimdallarchaeota archaeon]|nr:succinylglutamate desuccinylase/aspartoacylase family protein [Candidatus Heimdallarchaeota archaeon]
MVPVDFKDPIKIDWETEFLDLSIIPDGSISYGAIQVFEDRIGKRVALPALVAKGKQPGPVLGLTACIHGNEINGIPVIHQLFKDLSVSELSGTLVAIPIVNLPGYLSYSREFIDGADLNRVFPGDPNGTPSQVYADSITKRILKYFNYLVDFHTASFGRINSHYVRADLTDPLIAKMAMMQHVDIVVSAKESIAGGGTLRNTAAHLGIPAITLELGNPQVFQEKIQQNAYKGILNIMRECGMISSEKSIPSKQIVCSNSYWIRVRDGGILMVHPKLIDLVKKDEVIATLYDIYGREELQFRAPEDGIVIGINKNPVVSSGERVLYLGVLDEPIHR